MIARRDLDVVDTTANTRRSDRPKPEAGKERIARLIDDRALGASGCDGILLGRQRTRHDEYPDAEPAFHVSTVEA
jgi:hypothetical protein